MARWIGLCPSMQMSRRILSDVVSAWPSILSASAKVPCSVPLCDKIAVHCTWSKGSVLLGRSNVCYFTYITRYSTYCTRQECVHVLYVQGIMPVMPLLTELLLVALYENTHKNSRSFPSILPFKVSFNPAQIGHRIFNWSHKLPDSGAAEDGHWEAWLWYNKVTHVPYAELCCRLPAIC